MNADKSIKCWLGGGGGFSSERLCQLIKHSHYLTILKAFSDNNAKLQATAMNAWKMLQLSTLSVAVLLQETILNTCVCPLSFKLLRTYLKFQLRLILKVQPQ